MVARPPLGLVLFEGASALDGSPIVVIATGFQRPSRNSKTGDMIQTWILRSDVHPVAAVRSGEDSAICGQCPHRPANDGGCYVRVGIAPAGVWRAFKQGKYHREIDLRLWARLFEGRAVRFGAYGDPAAAPLAMWRTVAGLCASVTGYTHQWANERFAGFRELCMASVDTLGESILARAAGWRTFRIREAWEGLADREFVCPASDEAGKRTTCEACRACGGTGSRAKASPVIVVHGASAFRFRASRDGADAA